MSVASAILILLALTTPIKCENERRIVKGEIIKSQQFPWLATMEIVIGRIVRYCQGAIVAKKWILTAAHCLKPEHGVPVDPDYIRLAVGIDRASELAEKTHPVAAYFLHPQFKQKPGAYNIADIALIKLVNKLIYNRRVKPAIILKKYTEENYWDVENAVKVAGFGYQQEDGNPSEFLKRIFTKMMPDYICGPNVDMVRIDEQFCVVNDDGRDACFGDSGAPLMARDHGLDIILGVVSFGFGCFGKPTIFTRVSFFLHWIKETVKENS